MQYHLIVPKFFHSLQKLSTYDSNMFLVVRNDAKFTSPILAHGDILSGDIGYFFKKNVDNPILYHVNCRQWDEALETITNCRHIYVPNMIVGNSAGP